MQHGGAFLALLQGAGGFPVVWHVDAAGQSVWSEADLVVQTLRDHLLAARGIQQIEFTGSYRRGKDTVGDIDILVVAKEPAAVMDQLDRYGDREEVLARGETKMSIRTPPRPRHRLEGAGRDRRG